MTRQSARYLDRSHLLQAAIIAMCLLLAVALAGLGLAGFAVQQGLLRPPGFALQLGRLELSAPCPAQGFVCDSSVPYYALWRGDPQPDGSIRYRQLYFIYLKPVRRR
jgi:hypothetical protein